MRLYAVPNGKLCYFPLFSVLRFHTDQFLVWKKRPPVSVSEPHWDKCYFKRSLDTIKLPWLNSRLSVSGFIFDNNYLFIYSGRGVIFVCLIGLNFLIFFSFFSPIQEWVGQVEISALSLMYK